MTEVVALGCGLSPFRADRADGAVRDWVAEAALAALEDAGLERDQIDHSVMAYESDHLADLSGQGIIWHDTVGLTPRPTVRVEGGGATGGLAIRNAVALLRAGFSECVLVVGAERTGKSVTSATASELFAMSSDTDWEMPVGGHFTAYYALIVREHMRRYGTTEEQLASVSVKNHGNARFHPYAQKPMEITVDDVMASPPIASPLKLLDCSLLSDGAAAVILATRAWAERNAPRFGDRPPVVISGSGVATDTPRPGDRPLEAFAQFGAKRRAAEAAYAMAGISDPFTQLDVAEVYDSYTGAELLAYEALGFCELGASGEASEQGLFNLGSALPVNPSGGLLGFGAAAGATGVAQAVEIVTQLRGEADPGRQVPGARRGLSDCHAGTCTVAAVHVFERTDRGDGSGEDPSMNLRDFKDYRDIKDHFRWDIPERYNIAERILGRYANDRGRVALFHETADGHRQTWTFWQLAQLTNSVARTLRANGVERGDRVGIVLPQCPLTAAAHLALYKLGAVAVPMSMLYGPDSCRHILGDCGANAVIIDAAYADKVRRVEPDLPDLERLFVRGGAHEGDISLADGPPEIPSESVEVAATRASDPALLLYTSGTTGHPKGALHAHRILEGYLLTFQLFFDLEFDESSVFWTPSDWAWVGGLLDILLPALALGHPVLAYEGCFGVESAYRLMSLYGVTHVFLAPTALKMLAQVPNPSDVYALDIRVIASGGEAVADEVLAWTEHALGAVCNEFYGLTEVNHLAGSCARLWPGKAGSMGKPYPGREVEVVDEEGRPVGVGEMGQIVVRPGDPTMMLGYWNRPEVTAERQRWGWILTGDLAYRDEEGYVFFQGRNDDMIGSAGYRIGPAEVEEALLRHPAVAEAAVVGSPDLVRGHIVKAFVELASGLHPSESLAAELQTFVKENLAAYKYPREIEFVEGLPKTTTGKLNRRELRLLEQERKRG